MGDFEDVFGAGADAVDIIEGYNRQYLRASNREKANWWGTASEEELEAADQQDEIEAWRASMASRGYQRGPQFASYDELAEWDKHNKRPHVRRRNSRGFEIFFTDGKGPQRNSNSQTLRERTPPTVSDDDIPF